MNWFLVLLFWSPVLQDFHVADGWSPLPMKSLERCEERLEYIDRYLPNVAADIEHMTGCIRASSLEAAIVILRTGLVEGQRI